MEIELIIIVLVIGAVAFGLLFLADYFEKRYYLKHPPDDGTREEFFDDDG